MLSQRIARLPEDKRAHLVARLRAGTRPPNGDPWFVSYGSRRSAAVRLFCFPYAGGGASVFRAWSAALPEHVDVWSAQLPGRESRMPEPRMRRMEPLVEALHEAISARLDMPYVFFGHSMGALVAFELTRRLRRTGAPQPSHLFLAAFRAPHLPSPNIKIHHLPDEVLKTVLRKEGTPRQVLDNDDLMATLLPTLRADLELCDTYEYRDEPALTVPISVFGGLEDVRVSRSDLEQWRTQTSGPFGLTMLAGTHFFLHSAQDELLSELARTL